MTCDISCVCVSVTPELATQMGEERKEAESNGLKSVRADMVKSAGGWAVGSGHR